MANIIHEIYLTIATGCLRVRNAKIIKADNKMATGISNVKNPNMVSTGPLSTILANP